MSKCSVGFRHLMRIFTPFDGCALFFGSFGRRLLPTSAGRTTLCPTEIFQDDNQAPYLRLLPIDTRAEDRSLADLRGDASAWHKFELDLSDAGVLERQLRELSACTWVTRTWGSPCASGRMAWVPPMFIPEQFSTPLLSSQEQISKVATTTFGL